MGLIIIYYRKNGIPTIRQIPSAEEESYFYVR